MAKPIAVTSAPLAGIVLMVLASALFASYDTLGKYLTGFYPVLMIVWARYVVHGSLMALLFVPSKGIKVIGTQHLPLQLLRAVMLLLTTVFFTWGLSYLPLGEATAINFLAPLFVTALSWPLLGERVSAGQWVVVVLGFSGVLLIAHPGAELFTPAAWLPVISALCFCGYQLMTRHLSQFDSAITTNLITGLFNALLMSLLLPFVWQMPSFYHLMLMLVLGALGMFAQLMFTHAHHYAPAALLAPFGYSQIVFASLLGLIVFGHLPGLMTISGMAVICLSGMFSMWLTRRAADNA